MKVPPMSSVHRRYYEENARIRKLFPLGKDYFESEQYDLHWSRALWLSRVLILIFKGTRIDPRPIDQSLRPNQER